MVNRVPLPNGWRRIGGAVGVLRGKKSTKEEEQRHRKSHND